jgi:hypothetical protein
MSAESLSKTFEPLVEKYHELSSREKQLIWAMLAAGLFIGFYYLVSMITPLFIEQQKKLIQLETQVEALPKLVSRWSALSATKKSIESTFDSSDTGIGTRSYLEDLIKTKVGISDLKSIRALQPRAFGQDEKFENTIYTVNFFTTELKQVVDFLEGVTKGEQPLILSKITLKKTGTKLNVQVELSSISQKA